MGQWALRRQGVPGVCQELGNLPYRLVGQAELWAAWRGGGADWQVPDDAVRQGFFLDQVQFAHRARSDRSVAAKRKRQDCEPRGSCKMALFGPQRAVVWHEQDALV